MKVGVSISIFITFSEEFISTSENDNRTTRKRIITNHAMIQMCRYKTRAFQWLEMMTSLGSGKFSARVKKCINIVISTKDRRYRDYYDKLDRRFKISLKNALHHANGKHSNHLLKCTYS
jgi:hypothetical protein